MALRSPVAGAESLPVSKTAFEEGVAALRRGDFAVACPLLASSFEAEPLPGTLFTLAECEARWGKELSAYDKFGRFIALVASLPPEQRPAQSGRLEVAEARVREYRATLPFLQLVRPSHAPPDLAVELDGNVLSPELMQQPVALDAGPHRLVTFSAGQRLTQQLVLERGRTLQVVLVAPEKNALPPISESKPVVVQNDLHKNPVEGPGHGTQKLWGWTSLGVGVVGLGVAGAATVVLLGKKGTLDAHCDGRVCDETGLAEGGDVPAWNIAGTVGFVAGMLRVGVGGALLLTLPRDEATSTRLAPHVAFGSAGLQLEHVFQ